MFFTNLLEANLKVKFFAHKIIYYTVTKSTTDDIWELYNETGQTKALIITDNQTSGRGRYHNKWISQPSKSITCSFILEQIFNDEQVSLYSILIPISIIKGIKNFSQIDLQIKWPNDIVYQNKKVGGILIESKLRKNIPIFNIGIGLNVNENNFDFPEYIREDATSLKEIKGIPIQREPLLASILNELDQLINNLDNNYLIKYWIEHCSHINKKVSFNISNKKMQGIFKGINNKGQAIIEKGDETITYNNPISII